MHVRTLLPLLGFAALAASTCAQSPVDPQARAIFGNATGAGLTLVVDRESKGWIARRVWAGSPAAKAGMLEGDLVRAVNGVTLPETGPANPCGPQALTEPVNRVRDRIDRAGQTGLLQLTIEREGRPLELSVPRQSMAALYSRAKAPSEGSVSAPIVCMLCDKNCPGALNNEGYWTCEITYSCGDQTVQCKDRCLTS
jgi:hypothetical protein